MSALEERILLPVPRLGRHWDGVAVSHEFLTPQTSGVLLGEALSKKWRETEEMEYVFSRTVGRSRAAFSELYFSKSTQRYLLLQLLETPIFEGWKVKRLSNIFLVGQTP